MAEQHSKRQFTNAYLLGLALLAAAIAAVATSFRSTKSWPLVISPPLVTLCVIWWVRLLYFWQRPWSYCRREKRRKDDPAEKLGIPAGVKKAEQYDGVKTLHEAQWAYIDRAVQEQGAYFANGILAAILAPLALLLLSSQLLAPQRMPSELAVGLIISEILCLLILVYLGLTRPEPTAEWIENRARTELFRREQYLLLAGVGPYLDKSPVDSAAKALERRGRFEGANTHTLVELIPLNDDSNSTWLEGLYRKGSAKIPARTDFIERMESYLFYRIGKQLQWFGNEIRDLRENERLWSHLLIGALLAAIVVAALHAFDFHEPEKDRLIIGTLAIVLPPLGTACLAIRAMYNFRGRAQIYEHERRILCRYRGTLEGLVSEAKAATANGNLRDPEEIDFEFRTLALRTEQSLSLELEQWMLLMEKHEHELSP